MLTIRCRCGETYRAEERYVGSSILCSKCGQIVTIALPARVSPVSRNVTRSMNDVRPLQSTVHSRQKVSIVKNRDNDLWNSFGSGYWFHPAHQDARTQASRIAESRLGGIHSSRSDNASGWRHNAGVELKASVRPRRVSIGFTAKREEPNRGNGAGKSEEVAYWLSPVRSGHEIWKLGTDSRERYRHGCSG
jgi:rRNA maturation protein Nop10